MSNPFDKFDAATANPFDQFDAAPQAQGNLTRSQRFGTGMLDTLYGAMQNAAHYLPSSAADFGNKVTDTIDNLVGAQHQPSVSPQQLDQKIADREQAYEAQRAASGDTGTDWMRGFGRATSTLPLAALAPAPATLAGAAALGGGLGAASGALTPVTDNPADFDTEKLGQIGGGAATGALGSAALTGLSRFIQPKVSAAVSDLINRGVIPRPGQILGGVAQTVEDKLSSFPLVGDFMKMGQRRSVDQFNKAVYNDVLEPAGMNYTGSAVGNAGVKAVRDALSAGYDKVLPDVEFNANTQGFSNGFTDLINRASSDLPAPQATQFDKLVTNKFLHNVGDDGLMDGPTVKGVESELNQLSTGYHGDASFDQRRLGDYLTELQDLMHQNLMTQNPESAAALQGLNAAWSRYSILRRAASKIGTDEGAFNANQFLNAVQGADKSVGKGAFATGTARMQDLAQNAKSVLGSTYPDSGTAGRVGLTAMIASMLAHGDVNPKLLAGAGLLSLPYTGVGQRALAGLLAAPRPQMFTPVANALANHAPAFGGASSALLATP